MRGLTFLAQPRIGRLAGQFGLAFALAMAGAGALLYWQARAQIDDEVETSLRREQARILVPGAPQDTASIARRLNALTGGRVISDKGHMLLAPDGRAIWGRIEMAPPLSLPLPGFTDVRFRDGRPDWREGHALTARLPDGARLVIIEHSEAVENIHAMLPRTALILVIISIVVGSGAAWLFSALIAQRLARTMAAADALARGDLGQRIPDAGLDGVFAQQVAGLNRMIERMADMVHSQRQFASHLAHDLRTPLTRLRALLQADREHTDAAGRQLLERAERECRSIIAIFDALLRLSEIEAGRHPTAMAPLPLAPIIEDVAETMEPVIADAGSRLEIGALFPATIRGDVGLVHQLLVNLLDNVALHTPAQTCATISLGLAGDEAIITIADNGPGIAEAQRDRVMQPFERGAASNRPGSGLGLAIADAIMRFHDGSLELADNGPGLAVRLHFPLLVAGVTTF
ncbi:MULTISPECIES: sensor histidine kinase [unclassified Novosphingobium]|uniref:sensor histidine kinase n=1 Tax=unclassified Novosphingobium TaxID=2644732 RepID=UPI0008689849|nr:MULTISPECIES: HAMP domain-containing sensor histidine kinase [unclassified Novosphingobium]MBN9145347.1 HAMP domain-containing histidine kinase [Novosphingobium sp.]MDR6709727.1 signal transduction histidine kinase [Novosphingobium sp. 1748]ODU80277.1 MAG: hypothetical protein ABT10_17915 [Novosphingobium sp. SCN 63-17]OJX88785.1 MAG: hypothetical protein BGP00_01800 [Novosphingobium sp. 63-713]